jgi:hypothetical protein
MMREALLSRAGRDEGRSHWRRGVPPAPTERMAVRAGRSDVPGRVGEARAMLKAAPNKAMQPTPHAGSLRSPACGAADCQGVGPAG